MRRTPLLRYATAGAALVVVLCSLAQLTWATPGSGTTSTLVGRGSFLGPFKVKRADPATGWRVDVESKADMDIAVQTIEFPTGAYSGWHSHPGPVFISVVEGTMTFYDSDDPECEPVIREAGEGFLDVGDHAHFARNEGTVQAKNVVTYLAPRGAALRIDQPNPGNCAFRGF